MKRIGTLGVIALALVIIGALDWGVIGVTGINLFGYVFGHNLSPVARIVYILIGLSGLYVIYHTWLKKN